MTKSIFIFIASLLLAVPLILWYGEMGVQEQAYLCVPFILLFGIPHGAIDNVLYLRYKKLKLSVFIAFYLSLVVFYVIVWIYLPAFAYLSFLLLSAYHFGQSQLIHYFKKSNLLLNMVYFVWGILLISSLIYFNQAEIQSILSNSSDLKVLASIHANQLSLYVS